MGIELMDNRCLSMIRTSINQCLSVHILQYGWLEALPLLFIWVIYISGLWWLWFKYTWQESFSTYSENPVKRNNCQGSGCWIGKLWVIFILLSLNRNLSGSQLPCFSTVFFPCVVYAWVLFPIVGTSFSRQCCTLMGAFLVGSLWIQWLQITCFIRSSVA